MNVRTFFPPRTQELVRQSWSISWPMTLIMFFDFLIGLTDVYVAGRLGKEVQAAYGLASLVYFAFLTIAMSLTVGTVSVVSRIFTSGDTSEYSGAVFSSLITAGASGVVLGLISFAAGPAILSILSIPAVLKHYASSLVVVYSAGVVFHYFLLNSNGILRSSGRIRASLRTMALVAGLNVALDFFFVLKTPLGYQGLAVATVISVCAGAILNLGRVRGLIASRLKFSAECVKTIVSIGWPMAVLQFLWQGASMALYSILGMLPAQSVETMAAFTNGLRVESAIFLPAFAFNMANAVVVGNLIGKKERNEAFHNGLVTAGLGAGIVSLLSLAVIVFAPAIMSTLSESAHVVDAGVLYLRISLIFEPVMAWGVILGGGLSGAGDTRTVMKVVASSVWLVRVPLAYLFVVVLAWPAVSVWWAMNASLAVQTLFMSRRYLSREWLKV